MLALRSFPARGGFHLAPHACELLVPLPLALFSFRNYAHIVLFALFFLPSRAQFGGARASGWALLPDATGALLGCVSTAAWRAAWRRG